MSSIQFRWIATFRAVAQAGTTTGAAELLNIGQSAASKHVAALEHQLGIALFDRTQGTLRLTAEGETLLSEAGTALEGVQRFQRVADDLRQLKGGHLHIIAAGNVARGLLPQAVRSLREEAPSSTVSIEMVVRKQAQTIVESQQFDLAILAMPYDYPAEGLMKIGRYRGVCILPKKHPLASRRKIKVRDLANVDLISYPEGTVGRMLIDRMFHIAGIVHKPATEASSGITHLVGAGLGAAIVDPFVASEANPDLVAIRELEPVVYYEFGILLPVTRSRSMLSKRMASIIAGHAKQIENATAKRLDGCV